MQVDLWLVYVILYDVLVLNNRCTSNKRRTKISVTSISAAALNQGFTVYFDLTC